MSCSRISRLATFVLILAGGSLTGCRDDLPDPTLAEVKVRFSPAALARGAEFTIDGTVVAESLTVGGIDTLLAGGIHAFVLHPDCATVEPADSLSVEIVAGRQQAVEFRLTQSSGVVAVTSEPGGLPILLDGRPTNLATPNSLICIDAGTYEVAVSPSGSADLGFTITGDTVETVVVGTDETKEVHFALSREPVPQPRGVLVELFTATMCPNCGPAEVALHGLEHDPAFHEEWLSTCEVHLRWQGSDPFWNQELGSRASYYGVSTAAPDAYFNGSSRVFGSGYPDLVATYRSKITETYGQVASAALYWRNVRVEGTLLRGDLRYVAVDDLSAFGDPRILVFFTKDSLRALQYPADHYADFFGVIRDYRDDPVDLKGLGLVAPGSHLDLQVEFDLSPDAQWETPSIRLSASIQDLATRQVLQCREVRLRFPY